ncbi:uncharacterized protein JCM15063_004457 [Sporobolomyces koalae]|uniref:uncharacterized protein n=1 Tax=Sporobolomyces koalae TaxID=500713 RepID=UPI00317B0021
MVELSDLPVELLLHIHLQCLSSTLPLVSRSFYHVLSTTSPYHKAQYLLLRHPSHKTLSHAIKYPICTLAVLRTLERLHHERHPTKRLKLAQLPKRLFSSSPGSSIPKREQDDNLHRIELVRYLLETYKSDPNSHQGYPLTRAVFKLDRDLIALLLEHGADPGLKQGWAVVTAILKAKDFVKRDRGLGLQFVKSLIERDYPVPALDDSVRVDLVEPTTKRKKKKLKLEDRCKPSPEMLETAVKTKQWDIVDYLTLKGATPNLNVLKML